MSKSDNKAFDISRTYILVLFLFYLCCETNIISTQTVEQPPSLEQQAIEAATLAESERFSEIPESSVESTEDGIGNHSAATGGKVQLLPFNSLQGL